MKTLITFLSFIFFINLNAQEYNADLAAKLGADERGMKNYVLVILKTGTYQPKNKTERDSLFAGHFSNMKRLSDEGKLIVAGPFGENNLTYRGLFIFNVSNLEEAKLLVNSDPTVKSGLFDVEILPWYGSAALPVYLDTHKLIQKKPIK